MIRNDNHMSIPETLRRGLGELMTGLEHQKAFFRISDAALNLHEHPFRPLTAEEKKGLPVQLVASPQEPGPSVEAMTAILRHLAASGRLQHEPHPPRLRIYRLEYTEDWYNPGKFIHWVYFEIETGGCTYFCCGGNDFSGAKSDKEKMERVFALFSLIFGACVEEYVIPQNERAMEIHKELTDQFYEAQENRRSVA